MERPRRAKIPTIMGVISGSGLYEVSYDGSYEGSSYDVEGVSYA